MSPGFTTNDPDFSNWSLAQLEAASLKGVLIINDVIYAELSVRYASIEKLDTFIESAELRQNAIPKESLFLAGKAFQQYRRSGGTRTGVLPDFFIGAMRRFWKHRCSQGISVGIEPISQLLN